MDMIHVATEQAYKNGYAQAIKDMIAQYGGVTASFYYDDVDGEVVGDEAENLAQGPTLLNKIGGLLYER